MDSIIFPSLRLSICPYCWRGYFVVSIAFGLPLYSVMEPVADESLCSAQRSPTLWQIDGFHHSSVQTVWVSTMCVPWHCNKIQEVDFFHCWKQCKRDFLSPKSNQPKEEGRFIGCRNSKEFQNKSLISGWLQEKLREVHNFRRRKGLVYLLKSCLCVSTLR